MEPVLLVEDKAELREMLRKALEKAGYAIEEAPDGNTAKDRVRGRRYLVVLTDLKVVSVHFVDGVPPAIGQAPYLLVGFQELA